MKLADITNNTVSISGVEYVSPMQIICLAIAAFLAAVLPRKMRNRKIHEHRGKITQLPSIPIIGALPLLAKIAKDPAGTLQYYATKYGSTVFETTVLGKRHLFMTNPSYVKKLLQSNDSGHLTKPKWIYAALFTDIAKDGLAATTNIPEWKIHRNILNKAFTYGAVGSYFDIFNKRTKALVAEVQANTDRSLYKALHVTNSKIITEILVGENILTEKEYVEVLDDIEIVKGITVYKYYRPWLYFDFVWKLHSKSETLRTTVNRLENILTKAIYRYTEKQKENFEIPSDHNKCAMELLINAGLTNREVVSEIATGYVAGHDTTSQSTQMLLYNLAQHPKYQNLCRDEVCRVLSGSDQITVAHVSEMKYLEQCVKENLRMFPIVAMFSRELQSDLELDEGFTIKKGSLVRVPVWMIQRNPELYPNPGDFDPDRFLPKRLSTRQAFEYLPFSYGPRNCIGWKMAMFQIKLMTAHLLQNFEFDLDAEAVSNADLTIKQIWPMKDIGIKFRPLLKTPNYIRVKQNV